jgi:hypothetical protein
MLYSLPLLNLQAKRLIAAILPTLSFCKVSNFNHKQVSLRIPTTHVLADALDTMWVLAEGYSRDVKWTAAHMTVGNIDQKACGKWMMGCWRRGA